MLRGLLLVLGLFGGLVELFSASLHSQLSLSSVELQEQAEVELNHQLGVLFSTLTHCLDHPIETDDHFYLNCDVWKVLAVGVALEAEQEVVRQRVVEQVGLLLLFLSLLLWLRVLIPQAVVAVAMSIHL